MFADDLRVQFVADVIIPLCEKYNKPSREGWRIYQAAYYQHRQEHGSLARVPNRNECMLERVSFMMQAFFQWLYQDSEGISVLRQQQTTQASPAQEHTPG